MTNKPRVHVRAHTRRWPKRWDLRLFIHIDRHENVSIVHGRSYYDVEDRLGGEVLKLTTKNLKKYIGDGDVRLREI